MQCFTENATASKTSGQNAQKDPKGSNSGINFGEHMDSYSRSVDEIGWIPTSVGWAFDSFLSLIGDFRPNFPFKFLPYHHMMQCNPAKWGLFNVFYQEVFFQVLIDLESIIKCLNTNDH